MYSTMRQHKVCPHCNKVFTQFGYHSHMRMHEARKTSDNGRENPSVLPEIAGSIHGSLVRALSYIKECYERQGWVLRECDIRKFGEHGVSRLHTEQGEIRLSQEFCCRRLRFRIHRSCSDVYFIDEIQMI